MPSAIDLDVRRPAGGDVRAVAGSDHQGDLRPVLDQPGVDRGDGVLGADEVEVAGAGEALDQLAARRRAVLVDQHERDVLDVDVGGEAEDEELDHRADDHRRDHLAVLPELAELLDDHREEHAQRSASPCASRRT